MSKNTFYFPHDYDSTSDPKVLAMLGEYGSEGYGLYWRIIEMMHTETTHKLCLKPYMFLAISKQMSTTVQRIEAFVNDCITVFELFQKEGDFFWCERVFTNIEKRSKGIKQRSEAGKKSAESRKKATTVQRPFKARSTEINDRSTKSNKGEESIGKEIIVQEITKEESVVVNTTPIFNKFFEFFKRAAGNHFSDGELLIEAGKFENKYPNIHPNKAGPLINAWVSNIGKDMGKSWQKEPELNDYQKKYLEEKEKYRNKGSGLS
jgi:hypothetical protein